MIAWYLLSSSVRPSQVQVLQIPLNLGSRKQRRAIAQALQIYFWC